MNVPFIDLKRYENGFLDKWNPKVIEMSKNAQFIGGAEVSNLENGLKTWTETEHAVSCANGTDALQLALRAVGVENGDHVLIPDSTFWATFEAVVNVGAIPSVVDVDLKDGGVDINAFEEGIKVLKPKAAIIAHLYGWGTAKIEQIRALCAENSVKLIEDGAQCFGVRYNGKSIYQGALISTTSFYPAKVLGAAGDGGAVFTNDAELARKVRMYSNHGRKDHYSYEDVGWNSRMDSFQAAFVNISMEYLKERIKSRVDSSKAYDKILSENGISQILPPDGYEENGYCNVCLVDASIKAKLQQKFVENGIGFGNVYPSAMSEQHCSSKYMNKRFGGNNSIVLGQTVFNLPLFPYMTSEELNRVLEVFLQSFKELS